MQFLGRVDIPRLKLSTLVVDGDDDESLALAAGHVSGTAALGELGNSAVAGHRDSAFRALRGIRAGDAIRVAAGGRSYSYKVSWTQIVMPDDVSVLTSSGGRRELTLITCYPFRYLGSAPKRFIVHAEIS